MKKCIKKKKEKRLKLRENIQFDTNTQSKIQERSFKGRVTEREYTIDINTQSKIKKDQKKGRDNKREKRKTRGRKGKGEQDREKDARKKIIQLLNILFKIYNYE